MNSSFELPFVFITLWMENIEQFTGSDGSSPMRKIGWDDGYHSRLQTSDFPTYMQFKYSFQDVRHLFVYMMVLRHHGTFLHPPIHKGHGSGVYRASLVAWNHLPGRELADINKRHRQICDEYSNEFGFKTA
jgi:hypothetical protein